MGPKNTSTKPEHTPNKIGIKTGNYPAIFRVFIGVCAGIKPGYTRRLSVFFKGKGDKMAAKIADEPNDEASDEAVHKFETALSAGGDGFRIQLWGRTRPGVRPALMGYRDNSSDLQEIIEGIQEDYPKGGEFKLVLLDGKGQIRSQMTLELAPRPGQRAAPVERERPAPQNDQFMNFMLAQQARADQNTKDLMLAAIGLAGTVLPLLLNRKQESEPLMLLNAILDAKAKIDPPNEEDAFDKTLTRMGKMREAMGDKGGDGDGSFMGGVVSALGPVLAQVMAGQGQAQGGQTPVVTPQIAGPAGQAQNLEPSQQTEMSEADQKRMAFEWLLNSIKSLLEKDYDADDLYSFIHDQVALGNIEEADIYDLAARVKEMPSLLVPILANYGITDKNHVKVISASIGLLQADMEPKADPGGAGGNDLRSANDGEERSAGSGVNAGPVNRPRPRAVPRP